MTAGAWVLGFMLVAMGPVSCAQPCEDGQPESGVWTQYFANGNRQSEATMMNCLCNGNVSQFYPNGSLRISGRCLQGQYIGDFDMYSPSGQRVGFQRWKEGRLKTLTLDGGRAQFFYDRNPRLFVRISSDTLPLPANAFDNMYTYGMYETQDTLVIMSANNLLLIDLAHMRTVFNLRDRIGQEAKGYGDVLGYRITNDEALVYMAATTGKDTVELSYKLP